MTESYSLFLLKKWDLIFVCIKNDYMYVMRSDIMLKSDRKLMLYWFGIRVLPIKIFIKKTLIEIV